MQGHKKLTSIYKREKTKNTINERSANGHSQIEIEIQGKTRRLHILRFKIRVFLKTTNVWNMQGSIFCQYSERKKKGDASLKIILVNI